MSAPASPTAASHQQRAPTPPYYPPSRSSPCAELFPATVAISVAANAATEEELNAARSYLTENCALPVMGILAGMFLGLAGWHMKNTVETVVLKGIGTFLQYGGPAASLSIASRAVYNQYRNYRLL